MNNLQQREIIIIFDTMHAFRRLMQTLKLEEHKYDSSILMCENFSSKCGHSSPTPLLQGWFKHAIKAKNAKYPLWGVRPCPRITMKEKTNSLSLQTNAKPTMGEPKSSKNRIFHKPLSSSSTIVTRKRRKRAYLEKKWSLWVFLSPQLRPTFSLLQNRWFSYKIWRGMRFFGEIYGNPVRFSNFLTILTSFSEFLALVLLGFSRFSLFLSLISVLSLSLICREVTCGRYLEVSLSSLPLPLLLSFHLPLGKGDDISVMIAPLWKTSPLSTQSFGEKICFKKKNISSKLISFPVL